MNLTPSAKQALRLKAALASLPLVVSAFLLAVAFQHSLRAAEGAEVAEPTLANMTDEELARYVDKIDHSLGDAQRAIALQHASQPLFSLSGRVVDREETSVSVRGRAVPEDPAQQNAFGAHVVDDANLVVEDFDRDGLAGAFYNGRHYLLRKGEGRNAFGAQVPIWIYGPAPAALQAQLDVQARNSLLLSDAIGEQHARSSKAKAQADAATATLETERRRTREEARRVHIEQELSKLSLEELRHRKTRMSNALNDIRKRVETPEKREDARQVDQELNLVWAEIAKRKAEPARDPDDVAQRSPQPIPPSTPTAPLVPSKRSPRLAAMSDDQLRAEKHRLTQSRDLARASIAAPQDGLVVADERERLTAVEQKLAEVLAEVAARLVDTTSEAKP
ncbi:MAG TPA: hypothetical protein VEL07_09300 [Planctomycetota bacterium]|nr:hypothetical protein [Planctomycetota bacterium]